MTADLFKPFQLHELKLANRMVMAPLTRNRADEDGNATPMMVTHYKQRASAGLIITESSPVSPEAVGYPLMPATFTASHAESWAHVTRAVHSENSRIFIQLQHCGRISHPSLQPDQGLPVAPSALKPEGQAFTYTGPQYYVTPRALKQKEIPEIVRQFRDAAEVAKQAGFDGVEVHGANGYLIDQFLRDGSNQRTDAYGGTVQNRMRLLNEVLDAVCTIWPENRVGVRLSPENGFNTMSDSDPQAHFEYFAEQLSARKLAYLHVLEGDMLTKSRDVDYRALRSKFSGIYMANYGYTLDRAHKAVQHGDADLVSFGVPFLANPDLVRRFREALPLNEADPSTFYGGGEEGYNDYPFHG